MDHVTAVLTFLGLIAFLVWALFGVKSRPLHQPGFEAWLERLHAELDSSIDEYTVFTDGHPYTWTEIEFDELVRNMRKELLTQWGIGGWIPQRKEFSSWYRIDNAKKRIYIVPFVSSFDDGKLMHYEDYIGQHPKTGPE